MFATICVVLENGLATNFAEVRVKVVECPDLSLPEWNLAAPGSSNVTHSVPIATGCNVVGIFIELVGDFPAKTPDTMLTIIHFCSNNVINHPL